MHHSLHSHRAPEATKDASHALEILAHIVELNGHVVPEAFLGLDERLSFTRIRLLLFAAAFVPMGSTAMGL